MKTVIFIHGFNSNSQCFKSKVIKQVCKNNNIVCITPDFPVQPFKSICLIKKILISKNISSDIDIIGTNIGAFYASCFLKKFNINKISIIDPIYNPYFYFKKIKGSHLNILNKTVNKVDDRDIKYVEKLEDHMNQFLSKNLLKKLNVYINKDDPDWKITKKYYNKNKSNIVFYNDEDSIKDLYTKIILN